MTPIIISEQTLSAVLSKGSATMDNPKVLRQCPRCREVIAPSQPACEGCGLRFFSNEELKSRDLRDIYVGIGSGAFLLACVLGTLLRYF